jgi:hypothetical protein
MSLLKVNKSTKKDLNDSEADEISNKELKRTMIRMINEIKEDMNKFKEDTNKELDELKENSSK